MIHAHGKRCNITDNFCPAEAVPDLVQKQGRFEVYEGDAHPPLSPPNQLQPGGLMEQHLQRPANLAATTTDRCVPL